MGQMERVCVTSYWEGRSRHYSMNTVCVTLRQNSMPSLLLDHLTGLQEAQAEGRGWCTKGPGTRRGLASGRQAGCGLGAPQKAVLWVWGEEWGLQTAVPHLSEAAEGVRDQQLLKPW